MKRSTSLLIITVLILLSLAAGCGGSDSGSYYTGITYTPTSTPGSTSTPTSSPTVTQTPTQIVTPNLNDPTPTPVYTTDPNDFGPIEAGMCHLNVVSYEIVVSNKILTNELKCKLVAIEMGMLPKEDIPELVAAGVLKILPYVDVKIYDKEGGSLKYSGKTGINGDWKLENVEPGTYWVEFSKSGYTSVKSNRTFTEGKINIVNGVFNAP